MTFLFGSSKMPDINIPSAPVVPQETEESESVKETAETLKEEEKKKLKKGQTRKGTILTSPRGILTEPTTERKTLLGQ